MIAAIKKPWKLRLPQLSLRTELVLFTLICAVFGLGARWRQEVQQRGDAQRWLWKKSRVLAPGRDRGPLTLKYAPEDSVSWTTTLIRKWIDPEYDRRFEQIHLEDHPEAEEASQKIGRVYGATDLALTGTSAETLMRCMSARGLKELWIAYEIGDQGKTTDWTRIQKATTLESIEIIDNCLIGDRLANELFKLPKLKKIRMSWREAHENFPLLAKAPQVEEFLVEGNVSGGSHLSIPMLSKSGYPEVYASLQLMFDELASKEKLQTLELYGFTIDDEPLLDNFCKNSTLQGIRLEHIWLSPSCLRQITQLKCLEHLSIRPYELKKDELQVLRTMKSLKSLVIGTENSKATLQELQSALPGCKVTTSGFPVFTIQ